MARRSNTRARCSRVLTLSSEMPMTIAASLVLSPSISRSTTIAREARGSVASLIANPELTELYFGH